MDPTVNPSLAESPQSQSHIFKGSAHLLGCADSFKGIARSLVKSTFSQESPGVGRIFEESAHLYCRPSFPSFVFG